MPRALPLLAGLTVLAALVGCSGDDERPGAAAPGTGGSGASGGSAGTGGGTGGTAGTAGGSGGSAGAGGSAGTAGQGGSAGATGGSGGGGSDGGPIDTPCTSSTAFRATGASFVFPTPKDLAKELGALTYDYSASPVTVVLAAKPSGIGLLAVSATEAGSAGQVFPSGKKPELVSANIFSGGFSNATTQLAGWLRVVDQSGPRDIELENIDVTATTSNNCASLLASVSAAIAASQGSVTLDLPGGQKTIAELAGGTSGGGQTPDGGVGYPIKLLFSAESTDFDFGSL